MTTPFMAEIRMFAGNFAPRSWAFCAGQVISLSQNTALFSLLGTTFGGDGMSTFKLPDFRGRVPVGTGDGPLLTPMTLGQVAGTETTSILTTNLPAHNHQLYVGSEAGTQNTPTTGLMLAASNQRDAQFVEQANAGTPVALNASGGSFPGTGYTGSAVPISIVQPYLAMNFIIATQGVYPSRN